MDKKKHCKWCGNEYAAERSTSRYCSKECRKKWLARKGPNGALTPQNGALSNKPRRGLDIKCFADLPVDVQATINMMAKDKDGNADPEEHAKRTARAMQYQHLFPDRYAPQGMPYRLDAGPTAADLAIQKRLGKTTDQGNVRVAKPGDEEYGDEMKPCPGCGKDIRQVLTICLSCSEKGVLV